jgi:CRISPR/Cas system-associated exonuclease Cas4 (RecB family)
LSPSQVDTWLDCPARWYYKHALQLADPQTASLALGRAVHQAVGCALYRKALDGALPPLEQAEAYCRAHAAREFAAALTDDDHPPALIAQACALVRLYLTQAAPEIRPSRVELPLEGVIAGVRVRGQADIVTVEGLVIDLKTSGRKPAGVSQAHRLQLATYAMLLGADVCRIDTLVKTKTPALVHHTVEIREADRRYAETIYPLAAEGMESGLYPPRRNSLLCSRKHCAFWPACEADHGGSVE